MMRVAGRFPQVRTNARCLNIENGVLRWVLAPNAYRPHIYLYPKHLDPRRASNLSVRLIMESLCGARYVSMDSDRPYGSTEEISDTCQQCTVVALYLQMGGVPA